MAGGKTISENYAFAGMHHIFDQHTAAGIILVVQNIILSKSCTCTLSQTCKTQLLKKYFFLTSEQCEVCQ